MGDERWFKKDDGETDLQEGDDALVRRVVAGEAEGYAEIVKRYEGTVRRLVARHLPRERVDEGVHDVFVRAFDSLATFTPGRSLERWLLVIAQRSCSDYWRREYRSRRLMSEAFGGPMVRSDDKLGEALVSKRSYREFEEGQERLKWRERLRDALESLGRTDRMVVELLYLEGYSLKETAALLGWGLSRVKVRAHRARRKLRDVLIRNEEP